MIIVENSIHKFNKIQKTRKMKIDKLLHLSAGFILAVFTTILFKQWWIILAIPTLIGLLKELVYDKWMKRGSPVLFPAILFSIHHNSI